MIGVFVSNVPSPLTVRTPSSTAPERAPVITMSLPGITLAKPLHSRKVDETSPAPGIGASAYADTEEKPSVDSITVAKSIFLFVMRLTP